MPPPRPETNRARKLRQTANTAEQKAWAVLRRLRHRGFPVRRQHPVAGYTVDFAIVRAKLMIEVDGASHDGDGAKWRDLERDRVLQQRGWRVLRISDVMAQDGDALWELMTEVLGLT